MHHKLRFDKVRIRSHPIQWRQKVEALLRTCSSGGTPAHVQLMCGGPAHFNVGQFNGSFLWITHKNDCAFRCGVALFVPWGTRPRCTHLRCTQNVKCSILPASRQAWNQPRLQFHSLTTMPTHPAPDCIPALHRHRPARCRRTSLDQWGPRPLCDGPVRSFSLRRVLKRSAARVFGGCQQLGTSACTDASDSRRHIIATLQ